MLPFGLLAARVVKCTQTLPVCPASPTAKGTTAPFSPSSGKERSGSCFCVQAQSFPVAQDEAKHLPEGL